MLQVDSITASAGSFRLRDLSLSIETGACHVVLGPSGSGKSMLLRTILGIERVESGSIRVDGADCTAVPLERREFGYLPQDLGLFPHMTVLENLRYSARVRRMPAAQVQPLLDRLVTATGLGSLLSRFPATLSGGERQRVGLVRALVSRPRLVLLDEPFNALNESLRRELWWLLRALQQEFKLTLLLATHDLAEAYFLADQVTVLLNGRALQQGRKRDVFSRPVAPDVARFLGIETLQPGRIVQRQDGLVTIEVCGVRLLAVAPDSIRETVLVSIRGEDVALAPATAPSSARNRLAGRVTAVTPGSPLYAIELDVGFPLTALVTVAAVEELDLRVDQTVTAFIKAPAVHLIPT